MWFLKQKSNFLTITAIIILSLPVIWWLFGSGFFATDDADWMIIRFTAFHQALRDGEFPVRWLGRLNYGYGYPVVNFNYPLFLYLAEGVKILGVGFVSSIKIIVGLSMVASALFAYLWLNKIFDKWSSFLGSIFYLYAPYHIFDLYKRGSVGELLALAIAPFILWSIERKSLFWISVGVAGLILSHNILALLFLPIMVVYGFMRKVLSIKYYVLSIISGLALAAFFWIPAVFELDYTRFAQAQVSSWQEHFADFSLIGIASIFVVIGALYLQLIKGKRDNLSAMFIFIAIASALLSYSASKFIWQILPASFIQFPFRFLSVTILAVSFLVSWCINEIKGAQKLIAAVLFLIILFGEFLYFPYNKPAAFFDKGDSFYATNDSTSTIGNEYMPKWVKIISTERAKNKVEILSGKGLLEGLRVKNNSIVFTSTAEEKVTVRVNTIYFPGWKAYIDNKETKIDFSNDRGVMDINISQGSHNIKFSFGETPLRLLADVISLVSFVALLGLALKKRKSLS